VERNHKVGQNPPRVIAPIEEEEEDNDAMVEACSMHEEI
jgi:hypothetical protein